MAAGVTETLKGDAGRRRSDRKCRMVGARGGVGGVGRLQSGGRTPAIAVHRGADRQSTYKAIGGP